MRNGVFSRRNTTRTDGGDVSTVLRVVFVRALVVVVDLTVKFDSSFCAVLCCADFMSSSIFFNLRVEGRRFCVEWRKALWTKEVLLVKSLSAVCQV